MLRYYSYFFSQYNSTGLVNLWYEFGDWVPPPPFPQANGHLTSSFSYINDLNHGVEMANAIGELE